MLRTTNELNKRPKTILAKGPEPNFNELLFLKCENSIYLKKNAIMNFSIKFQNFFEKFIAEEEAGVGKNLF